MIYIEGMNKLPMSCKECEIRGKNSTSWVCGLVKWDHNMPIYYQNININEREWYEGKWKHPNCPLKEN